MTTKPDTETPSHNINYELPVIDFELGDETLNAQLQGLSLVVEGGASDKLLFNAYGRRLNSIIREVNATSLRTNNMLKQQSEVDTAHVARFKKGGASQHIAARVAPATVQDFDYEAVLCSGGKPFQLIRWREDASQLELWRDFSTTQGDGEVIYGVSSRIRLVKDGNSLKLDLATTGTWSDADDDADDGAGIAERLLATKTPAGEVELKAITDRFVGAAPLSFQGDSYIITSRLYPSDKGKRNYDVSFVAYSKAAKRAACRNGFDEKAVDLWYPDANGPRFCLGRDRNGSPMNFVRFQELIASFKAIGIVEQSSLEVVRLPESLSCD